MIEVIDTNLMQSTHGGSPRCRPVEDGDRLNRKKVIHFLKEEISNIREGMVKLIRAKSEQNLKIPPKSTPHPNFIHKGIKLEPSCPSSSSAFPDYELKELRQRVKYLQLKNTKLEAQLKQNSLRELKKNQEMASLFHIKMSLETENETMRKHINFLAEQIQRLTLQNQGRQVLAQRAKSAEDEMWKRNALNPEIEIINKFRQRSPWEEYEKVRRQYNHLVDTLRRAEAQIVYKHMQLVRKEHIIEDLNKKVIQLGMQKINAKYRVLFSQQYAQLG